MKKPFPSYVPDTVKCITLPDDLRAFAADRWPITPDTRVSIMRSAATVQIHYLNHPRDIPRLEKVTPDVPFGDYLLGYGPISDTLVVRLPSD